MPAIYFLDVPEYGPLIRALTSCQDVRCERARGYVAFRSETEIAVRREELGILEAIWFGALVAGYEGTITRFDDQELRLS
jgi:hypothetical protein